MGLIELKDIRKTYVMGDIKLPVLKGDETRQLLEKAQTGDEAARENAPEKVEKRLAYGEQCSWTERVRQMEDVLYKKGVLHESPEK